MQPPVVRKKIEELIRRRGEPMRIIDMVGPLKLSYGNIMQAAGRGAIAGDLVKLGPGTFGLPGMRATNGSVSVPSDKRRASIADWVSRQTRTDGHD
jgi:hypothetical protein